MIFFIKIVPFNMLSLSMALNSAKIKSKLLIKQVLPPLATACHSRQGISAS